MTNGTTAKLSLRTLNEYIDPDNNNRKAVIDGLARFNGVPTATVGIYERGETSWVRVDGVQIRSGTDHVLNEAQFWERIDDELSDVESIPEFDPDA